MFIGNKNIKANIYRIQANNAVKYSYFCIGFVDFMLAGKILIDYTTLFSPHDFDKNDQIILLILKMHEIDKTKLSDQTKFRLYEIKRIENYFINAINERKSYSKKLSKYVFFYFMEKILIVLSATNSGVSIVSFTSIIGVPAGTARATLIFSITAGIIKKLLSVTIKKKKKDDQILMLAKSKCNSIEALILQALNDIDISHKELLEF